MTLERRGAPLALDAGADQAAYGILREALTNAARHGAGPARVEIIRRRRRRTHRHESAPRGHRAPHGATRIVGMRERALLAGGRLETGRDDDDAFRVHAELPAGRPAERA